MDQHTMKVSDLYDIAIYDITRDGEHWQKYLDFAARGNLYRFDFLNTCIIYEQMPDAELLMDFESWKKVKRYVRGGEIGIATFPIEMLGGAQYVYDVKSTGGRLMPWTWDLNEENMEAFAEKLFKEIYQEDYNFKKSLKNFTRTYVRGIMKEENDRIHEIAVLTSSNEKSLIEDFILLSATYLILRRCGIDTLETGLSAVTNYQEEMIFSKIGIVISDIAETTLRRFADVAREIRTEERSKHDGRTGIQEGKRRSAVPDAGNRDEQRGGDAESGQIRKEGPGISSGDRQEPVQPVIENGETARDIETGGGGSVGIARPDRGKLREEADGSAEGQSGEYYGDDTAAERSGPDSAGDRDERSNLQNEIKDTEIQEGTADAVPSFLLKDPIPADIPNELFLQILLAGPGFPMGKMEISDFFEQHKESDERIRFLSQMYSNDEEDIVISGEDMELVFQYVNIGTGLTVYWPISDEIMSGYLSFTDMEMEIIRLIDSGEYYQHTKEGTQLPTQLKETIFNFLQVRVGSYIYEMIYDVMTTGLLPQQETEFIKFCILSLFGSDLEWKFNGNVPSTISFHEQDFTYHVNGEQQSLHWAIVRDMIADGIEENDYPEFQTEMGEDDLKHFSWFNDIQNYYRKVLERQEQIDGTETYDEKSEDDEPEEAIDDIPESDNWPEVQRAAILAVNRFANTSMALIPSKPLIQHFFQSAATSEKEEFLEEILRWNYQRYGESAIVFEEGLIYYSYDNLGTIKFRLNKGGIKGSFTVRNLVGEIQRAIDAGNYLPPYEYIKSVKEEFSLSPKETLQIYKNMSSRNQLFAEVSDFFYPDGWEIPSGNKTKYKNNVAAIRLLKELEQSSRPAAPEEQAVLAKYIGWGGLPGVFDSKNATWEKEYKELFELLTEEEYEQARGSTNSAFYTPPVIVRAVYQALEHFGFEKGSILEPGLGVGNFYSGLPQSMRDSKLHGVEVDSISGRIAKQLHPKAAIQVKGFEKTKFERDSFDLIVGNVPFGAYKIYDPEYKKHGFRIHDYFLARSVDLLRPGGILAVVTGKFTMDKANGKIRRYLSERARFIGAIRLPAIAFKQDAGAEITSDIIFLQKRESQLSMNTQEDWMDITYTEDGVPVNRYFINNPEMMLGKMAFDTRTFGNKSDYTKLVVEDEENFNLQELLNQAISHLSATYLPANEMEAAPKEKNDEEIPETLPATDEVANNTYTVIEGMIYYRENDTMSRWHGNEMQRKRILGMHKIRQAVRYLIDIQTDGCTMEQLVEGQERLNKIYDDYVKQYGYLSSRGNKIAFREDNDYYLLCSLESEDENKNVKKADIFYKQTIAPVTVVEKVDTAMDALQVSLAEYGKIHIPYMLSIYPVEREQLLEELKGQIYLNPVKADDNNPNQGWETASEYLSGAVRSKLKAAEAYMQMNPEYRINVEALKEVQPEDLSAADISVKLGTTWIELEDYEAFIFELLETPSWYRSGNGAIKVQLNTYTMTYKIANKSADNRSVAATQAYGTKAISAYGIIEALMNQNIITIKDRIEDGDKVTYVVNHKETTLAREKATAIKEAFKEWLWKEPNRRKKYVDYYNETFNNNRLRVYDGSYLIFPGMNPEIKMRTHQRNAVDRALHGSTLLAHAVGAGKTYEMASICMEMKRLKLMNKAMITVPNHLVGQMATEFLHLYPGANLLVTTKEDFSSANRKKLTCKIAANNYDAVIVGHSQFERIPLSAERRAKILEEEVWRLSNAVAEMKEEQGANWGIKDMERQKKNLEEQIISLRNDAKKDDVLDFEQLGIDALFVDEAHIFKNLSIFTKIRNVAGISTNGSQRAMDMYQKIQYIQEIAGGRNVIIATGTPISNTMCEMYVMQLYLQSQRLQEKGINHFDSWAANYGEVTTALEMSPEGGYRMRSRFNKFCNLPELMNMFREVADIQLPSMLNLAIPKLKGGKCIIVESVASESVDYMMQELADRAERIRGGLVDPTQDNMLKITNEARLLGTDPRLIDPEAEVDMDGKLFQAADNIYQEYRESQEIKGTQVVFSDIGTPTGKKQFNVYDFLKAELMKKGIPEEEIAFIHDAKNDKQKAELFTDMRSGRKRILIGSTSMMGTGTNIQKRLVAAHHIDCPWKPSDIEQREGRILRQGNDNDEVSIYRYITKKTFDSYLWGIVENKQRFISQIMTDKVVERECQDVDETILSFAEIKAIASGNPLIMEKTEVDTEVSRLQLLKAAYENQRYTLQDNFIIKYPKLIKDTEFRMSAIAEDITQREKAFKEEPDFLIQINGFIFEEREPAGSVLIEIAHSLDSMESRECGSYKGFAVEVERKFSDYYIKVRGKLTYTAEMSSSASGNMVRLENLLSGLDKTQTNYGEVLKEYKRNMEESRKEFEKPFSHELELQRKLIRQKEINDELEIKDEGQELTVEMEQLPGQAAAR